MSPAPGTNEDRCMIKGSALRGFEKPAPHRVIRNFLGPDLIAKLLEYVEANRDAFSPSQVGDRRVDVETRVSRIFWNLGALRGALETRFLAILDSIIADLRISSFDFGRLELALIAHGDGAFYRRHIDTRTDLIDSTTSRELAAVLYFHAEPKKYSGGELRLHSILPAEQGGSHLDITPEQDMLLLFPTWAPHEVRPVSCPSGNFMDQRFSLNCWYHRLRTPTSGGPGVSPNQDQARQTQ